MVTDWLSTVFLRWATDPLRLIGAACVVYHALWVARSLFGLFLAPRIGLDASLRHRCARAGDWAVISGASDGIGKAIALELASRKFNVCIIARTKQKLDDVGKIARDRYGVECLPIVFDFGNASLADYEEQLFPALRRIQIGLLVNCVGAGYEASPIDYRTNTEEMYMMKVNCEPQVLLSKHVATHFKSRRCGIIVNISSMCGVLLSHPYLAVYSGTKAFNLAFSESLRDELGEFGVTVMCVTPGLVNTLQVKGTGRTDPKLSFELVAPEEVARDVCLDLASSPSFLVPRRTAGHRNHRLLLALYELLPTAVVGSAILGNMKDRFSKRQREGRR